MTRFGVNRSLVLPFVALLLPLPSLASSCNNRIIVPIKFGLHATRWVHKGRGTHFFGVFAGGQNIAVAAAGGTKHDTRGDLSWSGRDPWQIFVEGPGGFTHSDDGNGAIRFRTPATGKYVISLGPCAIWGDQGTILVSASDPRSTVE